MILEYINAALEKAKYEIIEDDEPYYGEVPGLKGVWATGKNLEECRRNLAETIEGWVIIRLKKGLSIPSIGHKKFKEPNFEASWYKKAGMAEKTISATWRKYPAFRPSPPQLSPTSSFTGCPQHPLLGKWPATARSEGGVKWMEYQPQRTRRSQRCVVFLCALCELCGFFNFDMGRLRGGISAPGINN